MKILVDENIPLMTVRALREQGHDVLDLRGTEREGWPDTQLWTLAQNEKRLLISTDKGFARHRRETHCGVLVVALRQPNRYAIHERVTRAVERFDSADWNDLTVVVRDNVQSVSRFSLL